jgi:AraC-like DNA-binding protein
MRLSPAAKRDLRFGDRGASCLVAELDSECGEISAAGYAAAPSWACAMLQDLRAAPTQDARWRLEADMAVSDLVAWMSASRQTGAPPRWLLRIRDALRDGGIPDAGRLAADEGIHRVHLSRSFHAHFGIPVSLYVQRVRALRAVHLLRRPELTLAQVADEAGYFDQSHFCRSATRLFGSTPSALRARLPAYKTGGSFPV